MLGLKTRQITTYGKRSRRVVNVDDDDGVLSPAASRPAPKDLLPLEVLSPELRRVWQQRARVQASPKPKHTLFKPKARAATPPRTPLADNTNYPAPPPTTGKPSAQRHRKFSPYVSPPSRKPVLRTYRSKAATTRKAVIISSESSESSSDEDLVPARKDKGKAKAVVLDSDDEEVPPPSPVPKASKPQARRPAASSSRTVAVLPDSPIVISDSDDDYVPSPVKKTAKSRQPVARPARVTAAKTLPAQVAFVRPSTPEPASRPATKDVDSAPAPIPLPARRSVPIVLLTPLRRVAGKPVAPSSARKSFVARIGTPVRAVIPPLRRKATPARPVASLASSSTSSLASLDDDALHIPPSPAAGAVPAYLLPLVHECGQEAPYAFASFLETFPFEDELADVKPAERKYRKLGEASFSEVFAIGNVVLKVIPLRNEDGAARGEAGNDSQEWTVPDESDAKDVLREITITREMGALCAGFTRLLKAYVVRGAYPQLLLSLWDEYEDARGSESIRPDGFPSSQTYAILILPNLGTDLETFTFKPSNGWSQACAIFWQVAKSLCKAEEKASFEHRDLHWGQVLVQRVPAKGALRSLDGLASGVRATIIDFGLSRMQVGQGTETQWAPFAEEIFEGTGDSQFDVYRLMRTHNGGDWASFRPLTNVMWLHYLTMKLTQEKRLRKASTAQERRCAEVLLEVEVALASSVALASGRRKVRKGSTELFKSAADVVHWAEERGWLVRS